jgi:glyceraldehyde 3-phosphate dehydrogenase
MPNKVAINGLGRIGRAALKLAVEHPELDVVAVNEIGSLDNMVYLLRYDTAYGRYERQVEAVEGKLVIDGKPLVYLSERDPGQLPWGDLGVDLVLECTGRFTEREDAEKHVRAGARWVVLSGPTKSPDVPTIIHGVNRPDGQTQIISCASCTTNNITPLVEILDRHFGVEKALLTAVHAYTATQALVDSPGGAKDLRRGRATAQSFVPSSTGAATATAKALPAMEVASTVSRSAARWSSGPSPTSSSCWRGTPRPTRSTTCCARRSAATGTGGSSPSPRTRWSRPTSSRTPAPPSSSWT